MNRGRIYIFLVFVLLFAFKVKAQSPIGFDFNARYDVDSCSYDSGLHNIYWNDGMLCLGFYFDPTINEHGFTVSFYDTLGNLEWKKNIHKTGYEWTFGRKIIALNNAGFYVYGGVYNDSTVEQYDRFLAKFDRFGDTVFLKQYIDTVSNYALDMDDYKDTLLVLSEWRVDEADLYSKIYISKIDTNGVIQSTYLGPLLLKYADNILYDSVSNYIYVGGTKRTSPTSSFNVKVFIHRYNTMFGSVAVYEPSLTMNEYFSGFTAWKGRLYVASYVTGVWGGSYYQGRVGQLNPSVGMGYLFYHNFGPESANGGVYTPLVINNNYIAVPGCYSNDFDGNVIYFADSLLNLKCETTLGYSDTVGQAMGYLTLFPGEKIAVCGLVFSSAVPCPQQDHWNFITQSISQYLSQECHVGIEDSHSLNSNLLIYPNPVNGNFNIRLEGDVIRDITVYNLEGKSVMSIYEINEHELAVAHHLLPGVYLVEVISVSGHKLMEKLIVVEQ